MNARYPDLSEGAATARGLVGSVTGSCGLVARRKVVIGHPRIGRGGSESNVMWLIEALKGSCDVTVMTTGGWELSALNDYYGTAVAENDVTVRIAPIPMLMRNLSAAALRGACYQRFARHIAGEYDIRISAYNPTDWGLPAVHFIGDFTWNTELRDRLDPPTPGYIYRDTFARKAYLKIAEAFRKPSGRNVLQDDLVIANSHWSANILKLHCGVDCSAVVCHPVWAQFPEVSWQDKELAFAMIGRIAPEKRIEQAIEILEAVRRRGHPVRLHLCGQIGNDQYGRRIADLCKERVDWIIPEGRVSGATKARILANCQFGIQTRGAEPFGISVAEMVKAGEIVFAPNDGGQAEILQHPDLLFANVAEAVDKIVAVLEQPLLQSALRSHLIRRGKQFSAQTFMHEARECIAALLTAEQPAEPSS